MYHYLTGVSLHGNTYQVVLDSLEEEREKLVRFLRKQGFDDAEIRSGLPSVERAYEDVKNDQGEIIERRPNGYDGSLSVTVNTKKLDKIQTAEQAIRNLRAKNDFIEFSEPQYLLEIGRAHV